GGAGKCRADGRRHSGPAERAWPRAPLATRSRPCRSTRSAAQDGARGRTRAGTPHPTRPRRGRRGPNVVPSPAQEPLDALGEARGEDRLATEPVLELEAVVERLPEALEDGAAVAHHARPRERGDLAGERDGGVEGTGWGNDAVHQPDGQRLVGAALPSGEVQGDGPGQADDAG